MKIVSRKKRKIVKLLIKALLCLALFSITVPLYLRIKENNTAPDESSALYGGIVDDNAYPFAGYLISHGADNKTSICGTTYLGADLALSAAHCLDKKLFSYLGYSLFKFDLNQNFLAKDIIIHPQWNNTPDYDVALIKLPSDYYNIDEYAEIATPRLGCDYEVLGYGKTEEDNEIEKLMKQRKTAEFCIEEINDKTFTLKGTTGGICFGDSGSPVFEKNTNKIIGVISSIVSFQNDIGKNPCSIGNLAIAHRLDTDTDIIDSIRRYAFSTESVSKCGQSCIDSRCSFGLVCMADKICKNIQGFCLVGENEYCSESANIRCKEGFECSTGRCVNKNKVQEYKQLLQTDLNIQAKEIISKNSPSKTSYFYYIFFITLATSLGLYVYEKLEYRNI